MSSCVWYLDDVAHVTWTTHELGLLLPAAVADGNSGIGKGRVRTFLSIVYVWPIILVAVRGPDELGNQYTQTQAAL